MSVASADLSIVQHDCTVLEHKMVSFLKETRFFFDNILEYLEGKRKTKSNFTIVDTKEIPKFVETITETLENGQDYGQLDYTLSQLRPKRNFLFDTLELYLTKDDCEQQEAAKALHDAYLEKVVWKLCSFGYDLARKSAGRVGRNITNVSYEDKVGYAYIGLVKAAHKFDLHKGIKFSTYASWWIWESILNGCNTEMYFLKIETPMRQRYIKFLSSMRKKDGKENEHLSVRELNNIYSSCNVASIYGDDGSDNSDMRLDMSNQENFYRSNPENILRVTDKTAHLQEIINTKLTIEEKSLLTGFYGVFDSRKRSSKQLCKSKKITEGELQVRLDTIHRKIRFFLD